MNSPAGVLGWDIGGVNTKVTRLPAGLLPHAGRSVCLAYELQRDPFLLGSTLKSAAGQLGAGSSDHHAITMTAELSQAFRTKREGVNFILDAFEATFPRDSLHVYTVAGQFVTPGQARLLPLEVAASNWAATANWVARLIPTCVLVDIGTTTTDIIPISGGRVVAQGRTDPARLRSGELVYTGALRTPIEAITGSVPLWGEPARLSAEGFALTGDVYLWLGRLSEVEYTWPTPDGRPASREYAGERLARAVCADRELLDDAAIEQIARAVEGAQRVLIAGELARIRQRWPGIHTAVVTGLGAFIASDAAAAAGLNVVSLSSLVNGPAQTAPATAVATLYQHALEFR